MVTVAVTSNGPRNARRYVEVMEHLGVQVRLLLPEDVGSRPTEKLMEGVGGLLLPGGPDVDPVLYGASPDPSAGLAVCRPLHQLLCWPGTAPSGHGSPAADEPSRVSRPAVVRPSSVFTLLV